MKRQVRKRPATRPQGTGAKNGFARLFSVVQKHLGLNVHRIHPRVWRRLYKPSANVRNCDGTCCSHGTTVSIAERDAILANRIIVAEFMTSWVRRHVPRWFNRRVAEDDDFTAGRALTTAVVDGMCVFYRKDGLCALQVAGDRRLGNPYAIKPSVCLLWPLCVHEKTLDVGVANYTGRRDCCAPMREGSRSILQVIIPDESLIRRMSRPANSRGGGPPAQSP